jgi:hypothetical protein
MNTETVTLSQVDDMQARLDDMRAQIEQCHTDIENASHALATAHAEGGTDKAASLAESRRNARDMAQDLEAAAEVLAGRVVEARELAAANAARDRLDAIDREHSRKRAELTKDEKRVQDAVEALMHVVAQANKHYKDARKLENEAAVLAMRWPEMGAPALNCGREVMERATVAASLSSLRREMEADRIKCPGKPKPASMQANFTPEQKREAVLQGLAEYLDGRTSALYPSGGDPDSEGARLVMLAGLNPGEDKRAFCDQ